MYNMARCFKREYTRWKVVDSHWTCVYREYVSFDGSISNSTENLGSLAEYLWLIGDFDIPECVTYCLATNNGITIKYRAYGGHIDVYAKPL